MRYNELNLMLPFAAVLFVFHNAIRDILAKGTDHSIMISLIEIFFIFSE